MWRCLNPTMTAQGRQPVWYTVDGTNCLILCKCTCARMLRSATMKMPRLHTIVTGAMASDPILNADCSSWCCRWLVEHQSSFDLLAFNWRRLDCIQLWMSSMTSAAESHIWQMAYKRCILVWQKPFISIRPTRLAVYMINRIGPSTEPWGTPQSCCTEGDFCMPRRMYCERPWRYERNHAKTGPSSPKDDCSRLHKIL